MIGPRDGDGARLQRLAETVQRLRREFRQFVQKEHAMVREADLARPRMQAAAGQRRHAGAVVRRAEGAAVGDCAVRQGACDRMDHRDLQQFAGPQRRQDRG